MYFQDLYADFRIISRILLVQEVCLAVGSALLFMAALGYINTDYLLPRWLMVAGSFAVVVWCRSGASSIGNTGDGAEQGACAAARQFQHSRRNHPASAMEPHFGYHILGYLSEEEPVEFPVPCLGRVSDVKKICENYRPTRIVVGMAERRNRLPMTELLDIRFSGVVIEDAADTYEMAAQRVFSSKIQPSQLIFTSELGPRPSAIAAQSIYSLLSASSALFVRRPLCRLSPSP